MVVVGGGGGNAWAKEMTLRRRMSSIFNKTREHFPSLKDYNDYLEEVEDMSELSLHPCSYAARSWMQQLAGF
uniref:MAT1 centre domain-containing protein n=1 Tax=Triticum urartu TaxID=4572 RepID=A0A8R7QZH2_TRIUA